LAECAGADPAHNHGIDGLTAERPGGPTAAVGMVAIRVRMGSEITALRVYDDEQGRRSEMSEYRTLQSPVFLGGKGDSHDGQYLVIYTKSIQCIRILSCCKITDEIGPVKEGIGFF
jgi:hypothetical protein